MAHAGSLVARRPWGVLIALQDENGVLLGVIDQPYIGERFVGGFGTAQMSGPHGEMPLRTSTQTTGTWRCDLAQHLS
jgi:fructose-1,6-bisphosphatase/inositol monophosphatase family enzyme